MTIEAKTQDSQEQIKSAVEKAKPAVQLKSEIDQLSANGIKQSPQLKEQIENAAARAKKGVEEAEGKSDQQKQTVKASTLRDIDAIFMIA